MYQGIQCPKCLRHTHETFYDKKSGKYWAIDRCAFKPCRHNFDIEAYVGSISFFNEEYKKQHGSYPPKI